MADFKKAAKEVTSTLTKIILFNTALNTILVFLVAFVIFAFFRLPLIFPIAAAIIFAVYTGRKGLAVNKIRMVEQKYKGMDERLRTAAEYSSDDNLILKQLHTEVLHDLKNVEESAFLNEKNTYIKSLAIIGLCFLILILSPVTFGILNFNFNLVESEVTEAEDPSGSAESGGSKIKFLAGSEDTGLKKAGDDIYGKPTIAKLGDSEIKIRIKPAGTELSIRDIQEVDLPDFSESYPSEIQAVSAESYEETIAKEDLELVRNYFNRLASN